MPWTKEDQKKYAHELWFARKNAYLQLHGPCIKCGSWNDLEFHHRDPEQKIANINWLASLVKRELEIAKCDILCRSCHISIVPFKHGTTSCYSKQHCRCKECVNAKNIYSHNRYKQQKIKMK